MHTVEMVGQTSGVDGRRSRSRCVAPDRAERPAQLPATGSAAGELTPIGTALLAARRRARRGEPSPAHGGAGDLMARRTRRVALALVGGLVALGPALVPSVGVALGRRRRPSAARAPTRRASPSSSTSSAFGGGVQVRCAPQPVRIGLRRAHAGGLHLRRARRSSPACSAASTASRPTDPCHGAPPPERVLGATGTRPRGGSWTYSTSGAGSRVPPPGSVEGWAFGDGDRAGGGPARAAADDHDHDRPTTTTTGPPRRDRSAAPPRPTTPTDGRPRTAAAPARPSTTDHRRLDERPRPTTVVGPDADGRRRRRRGRSRAAPPSATEPRG